MRALLISTIILITGCETTKLVNVHKPLRLTQLECEPTLPQEIKDKALQMAPEDKRTFINAADYYRAKITTLCNLVEAHNNAHEEG